MTEGAGGTPRLVATRAGNLVPLVMNAKAI
jgi:hypothetical protein